MANDTELNIPTGSQQLEWSDLPQTEQEEKTSAGRGPSRWRRTPLWGECLGARSWAAPDSGTCLWASCVLVLALWGRRGPHSGVSMVCGPVEAPVACTSAARGSREGVCWGARKVTYNGAHESAAQPVALLLLHFRGLSSSEGWPGARGWLLQGLVSLTSLISSCSTTAGAPSRPVARVCSSTQLLLCCSAGHALQVGQPAP